MYGVDEPGTEITVELLEVLINRLDEATLDALTFMLLRNPKHSQLLYKPNRAGETPYNIDLSNQKSILGQVFGARKLNTNEDTESMLGKIALCVTILISLLARL